MIDEKNASSVDQASECTFSLQRVFQQRRIVLTSHELAFTTGAKSHEVKQE